VSALGALLASELNVKRVEFVTSTDNLVSLEAKGNFRTLGKKFGKETPLVAEAVGTLDAALLRQLAAGESVTIEVAGASRLIAPEDVAIIRRASGAAVVQENGGYGVALDPTITPALRAEGLSREVISRIQRLRKEAGLAVSDRIAVAVAGEEELEAAVAAHRVRIAEEVLAVRVLLGGEAGSPFAAGGIAGPWTASQAGDVDGRPIRLALTKEGS
jgi:isoleucyl-tRNA synthetase